MTISVIRFGKWRKWEQGLPMIWGMERADEHFHSVRQSRGATCGKSLRALDKGKRQNQATQGNVPRSKGNERSWAKRKTERQRNRQSLLEGPTRHASVLAKGVCVCI